MTLDSKTLEAAGTYPMPPDGWVCFHCGERFTTLGAASDHFGPRPGNGLACKIKAGDERGLVMELRKAQDERDEARAEVEKLRETGGELVSVNSQYAKQTAALREALADTTSLLENFSIPRGVTRRQDRRYRDILRQSRTTLTDTAAAAAQYQRVPEGWVITRHEPNSEMYEAAFATYCRSQKLFPDHFRHIFQAMLAAAPKGEASDA